jgi:hypothetical protein
MADKFDSLVLPAKSLFADLLFSAAQRNLSALRPGRGGWAPALAEECVVVRNRKGSAIAHLI